MQILPKYKVGLLIVFILVYLGLKHFFWPMHKSIHVTVLKPNTAIVNLNSYGKIIDKKQFDFDKLSFPSGQELFHQNTGFLGYKEDFLIQAKTEINVLKPGKYIFVVDSDDGFSLKLNQEPICEHINVRPMQSSTCEVQLTKGKQNFELKYFQGHGKLGLKVSYKLESQASFLVGTDSQFMTFQSVKNRLSSDT